MQKMKKGKKECGLREMDERGSGFCIYLLNNVLFSAGIEIIKIVTLLISK
jgi:hypothetical protein